MSEVKKVNLKDTPIVFKTKKVAALAIKMNSCVKDIQADARHLRAMLILQEDVEREFDTLNRRYGRKGLVALVECMGLTKQVEEEIPTEEEE